MEPEPPRSRASEKLSHTTVYTTRMKGVGADPLASLELSVRDEEMVSNALLDRQRVREGGGPCLAMKVIEQRQACDD